MRPVRFLTYIIPLAVLAIIGLIAAQAFWFQHAFELKKAQFDDKVFVLINQIATVLAEDETAQSELMADILAYDTNGQSARENNLGRHSIRKVVDEIFEINEFQTPYYYAIHEWDGCSNGPLALTDLPEMARDHNEPIRLNPMACPVDLNDRNISMSLFFPDERNYLLGQTSGLLFLSLFLVLFLSIALAYTLYVVHRQKKISQIKNDFINNLSHEFKTPIASISLAAKVLNARMEKHLNHEDREYLRLISTETKRLDNHVDKVLQMAIVDSGKFDLELSDTDIHDIIRKVVDSCQVLMKEKKGKIALDLRADRPILRADATHLFNLFYNLLDNAIKYSESPLRISISTTNESGGFCFKIRDNGIGIQDTDQANIFEKFYRVTEGDLHKIKGFGLGLSYVKTIVEAHRGNISLKSMLNRGSEFTIHLPPNPAQ